MKVTSLVDNISNSALASEHGLSLFIELDSGQKILFDMGQSALFAENARCLGLSIEDVDIAVVSHGHYDHGGGLETFLERNKKAKVYIRPQAFEGHYSLRDTGMTFIGIDHSLESVFANRFVFCNDVEHIADGITLFATNNRRYVTPSGNKLLFGPSKDVNDTFVHEQSLLIEEGGKHVLIGGCAHTGIANIVAEAATISDKPLTHVFSGMHLAKFAQVDGSEEFMKYIKSLSQTLLNMSQAVYFTMHCTGDDNYQLMKELMPERLSYLSVGESVTV